MTPLYIIMCMHTSRSFICLCALSTRRCLCSLAVSVILAFGGMSENSASKVNEWWLLSSACNKAYVVTSDTIITSGNANQHLCLRVRSNPGESSITTVFSKELIHLVGQNKCQRHQFLCFICSIPNHHTLRKIF